MQYVFNETGYVRFNRTWGFTSYALFFFTGHVLVWSVAVLLCLIPFTRYPYAACCLGMYVHSADNKIIKLTGV